jgi:NDP-sugar pyrophosphorylase family protein
MNIIIPMAGIGSRFTEYGFTINKYLLPINKNLTTMIEMAIITLNVKFAEFIFILREENEEDNNLRDILKDICLRNDYNFKIISVNKLTEGPASTVYEAKQFINNDLPLIVSNSDQILDYSFNAFYNKSIKYDGCVLTYYPDYELTLGEKDKHSFVKSENGKCIQFVEKTVISKEALIGVHYYKKGKYFVEAYEYMYKNNIRAPNNEFYLSYTYQAMLDLNYDIGTHLINDNEKFYPVGEPIDYFNYYNKNSKFSISNNFSEIDFIKYENGLIEAYNEIIIIVSGKIKNKELDIFYISNPEILEVKGYFLRLKDIKLDNFNFNNYTRGWLIGDFEPCVKRSKEFELGLLSHKKDEKWTYHYHKKSKEINILINGKMMINNILINKHQVFVFDKNIIACPIFIEDCRVLCIKIPSSPGDKYII